MMIVLGFALISASLLLISYVAKLKNSPAAPKWTGKDLCINPIIFITITGLLFGLAFMLAALADMATLRFGVVEAGLLAIATGVTFFLASKIRTMGRSAPRQSKWRVTPVGGAAQPNQPVG